MFSSVISGMTVGIESSLITVETDISSGLPSLIMVGSLSARIKEAGERVRVAIKNAGIDLPPRRITVNFSPADLPKRDTVLDLPIAAGILACLGVIEPQFLENVFIAGELSLDGEVRPIRGVLPMVEEARQNGIRLCLVPRENAAEGAVIPDVEVVGVHTLQELIAYLGADTKERRRMLPPAHVDVDELFARSHENSESDFASVHGQAGVKRVLEIAAAGFHNVLMVGPPGSGKSMMARCLPGILPALTYEESMEVTRIYSVAGKLPAGMPLMTSRAFVSPHHSATLQALSGGGSMPSPGLISLAHRGVLFMDEFPQFGREKLNLLRQPMEDHTVTISRVGGSVTYPSRFLLVAAANPCPCGYYPDLNRCTCTKAQIERYQSQVPGPILDRIDLSVDAPRLSFGVLTQKGREESSREIRERVMAAQEIQQARFAGTPFSFNADMNAAAIERFCALGRNERMLMKEIYSTMGLSARGYHRILKTARTIADLDGSEQITEDHLAEAVGYRTLELSADPETESGGCGSEDMDADMADQAAGGM